MPKGGFIQYLVGGLMVAFSIYQVYINELWEFALYSTAGAAFIWIGLIKDNVFAKYDKQMKIISWALIIATAFIFFFLVRTDA